MIYASNKSTQGVGYGYGGFRDSVDMGILWGFSQVFLWVWDGYGDNDESPWVCGDSMGIFEWIPNYVETS